MGFCQCGRITRKNKRKCNNCKKKKESETFIEDQLELQTTEQLLQDLSINSPNEVLDSSDLDIEPNFIEIDSIHLVLKYIQLHELECNLSLYTEPKFFNVGKKKGKKIGWIQFIKYGFQCNIIVFNCNHSWNNIYENSVNTLPISLKKFFFPILPKNVDKIVYYNKTEALLQNIILSFDNDIILFGKGLKCGLYKNNIIPMINSIFHLKPDSIIEKEHQMRIDFAKIFFDYPNFYFNIDSCKNYIEKYNGIIIDSWRLFNNQFGEFSSIIANLRKDGVRLCELTFYYHNSLMYRSFFQENRRTIPIALGKGVSKLCGFSYLSKYDFIESLIKYNKDALKFGLIPRIELRVFNFYELNFAFQLFCDAIQNINSILEPIDENNVFFNKEVNLYMINLYKSNNVLNDQILLEELIRIYFVGVDSNDSNNFIKSSVTNQLFKEIICFFKVNHKIEEITSEGEFSEPAMVNIVYIPINENIFTIDGDTSDNLQIRRIYNCLCKNKQIFTLIQFIIKHSNNKGPIFITTEVIGKLFFKQLILDLVHISKTNVLNTFTYDTILVANEQEDNEKLYLIKYDGIIKDYQTNDSFFKEIYKFLRLGKIPPETLFGSNHSIRTRNRKYNTSYSIMDYTYNLIETFLLFPDSDNIGNETDKISGFDNSNSIIRITFIILNMLNNSTWGKLYNIKKIFADTVQNYFFKMNFKIYPCFSFLKVHSVNKNCFLWINLDYTADTNDFDDLVIHLNELGLQNEDSNLFIEPISLYDAIINSSSGSNINCIRLPIEDKDVIFHNYILKLQPKFLKAKWDSSINVNRIFIINNIESYISLLSYFVELKDYSLSKYSKSKYILALRYLMFVSGTIFMKQSGILTKNIRKEKIIELLPIFCHRESSKDILMIDPNKFATFVSNLVDD